MTTPRYTVRSITHEHDDIHAVIDATTGKPVPKTTSYDPDVAQAHADRLNAEHIAGQS